MSLAGAIADQHFLNFVELQEFLNHLDLDQYQKMAGDWARSVNAAEIWHLGKLLCSVGQDVDKWPAQLSLAVPQEAEQYSQPDIGLHSVAEDSYRASVFMEPEPPPPRLALEDASSSTQNSGEKPSTMQNMVNFLQMLGAQVPKEVQDLLARDTEVQSRTSHMQLMQESQYGAATPRAFPSEEAIKTLAKSAKAGFWIPEEVLKRPKDLPQERHLVHLALQLVQTGHPAIWNKLMTPAAVLNELYQFLSLAADTSVSKSTAEKTAMEYIFKLRAKIWDFLRCNPRLTQEQFAKLLEAWHERDLTVMEEARRQANVHPGPQQAKATGQRAAAGEVWEDANHCLWFSLGTCSATACKMLHSCPFCASKTAGCLATHLAKMRTPRVIVTQTGKQSAGKGGEKGSPAKPFRDPTTSWKQQGGGQNATWQPRRLPWEDAGKEKERPRSRSPRRRSKSPKDGRRGR
jgi:hypothetical protein